MSLLSPLGGGEVIRSSLGSSASDRRLGLDKVQTRADRADMAKISDADWDFAQRFMRVHGLTQAELNAAGWSPGLATFYPEKAASIEVEVYERKERIRHSASCQTKIDRGDGGRVDETDGLEQCKAITTNGRDKQRGVLSIHEDTEGCTTDQGCQMTYACGQTEGGEGGNGLSDALAGSLQPPHRASVHYTDRRFAEVSGKEPCGTRS